MQLPAGQTESVYVAARLNGTYGSLTLYTTPEEKSRVRERDVADTGNVIGYAVYTSAEPNMSIRIAQRLSVSMRYARTSQITSIDILQLIDSQRIADLVQLGGAFGWPDYKYLPIPQSEPQTYPTQLQMHIDTTEVCLLLRCCVLA